MKLTAFAIAVASFAAAAPVVAAERVSDVDYMRASRCAGLASSVSGVVDAGALDAYLKASAAGRAPYVKTRAEQEYDRARREGRSDDRKARVTAELTGACQAYLGDSPTMVKREAPAG